MLFSFIRNFSFLMEEGRALSLEIGVFHQNIYAGVPGSS